MQSCSGEARAVGAHPRACPGRAEKTEKTKFQGTTAGVQGNHWKAAGPVTSVKYTALDNGGEKSRNQRWSSEKMKQVGKALAGLRETQVTNVRAEGEDNTRPTQRKRVTREHQEQLHSN